METLEVLRKQAKEIVTRADHEHRELSEDEELRLDEILTEYNVAEKKDRDRRGRDLERLFADGDGRAINQHARSLGELVVKSDQYHAFRQTWPDGLPNRTPVGQALGPIQFGGLSALMAMQRGMKANGITEGGAIIGLPEEGDHRVGSGLSEFFNRPQFWGGWGDIPYVIPPLMIRNLITVGTTTSDLIIYPQLRGVNNRADFVAPGDLKPESDLDFGSETVPVGTIAHMLTVTRIALADVPALRTYLDNFLMTGLDEVLERAVLIGSPPNMEGLINTPGVLNQPFDTDILQTARKAITRLMIEPGLYTQPTAFVLSPEDAETLDLIRDNTGRYYGAGPWAMGPNTLWGLPRALSYLLPAGTGWVADWRNAVLWDRQQGTLSASDSHKDYFQRNLVAILAELRAAFGVLRPGAFCKFDTGGGSSNGGSGGGETEPGGGRAAAQSPEATRTTPPSTPPESRRRST